jgi:hypothetical protein
VEERNDGAGVMYLNSVYYFESQVQFALCNSYPVIDITHISCPCNRHNVFVKRSSHKYGNILTSANGCTQLVPRGVFFLYPQRRNICIVERQMNLGIVEVN